MRPFRRRLIGYLVIAAAALVAALLVLITLGYLVLPSAAPAPVRISQTNYTLLEGKDASGAFWFGVIEANSNVSFTDQLTFPDFNGYPARLAPGGTFGVDLVLWNNDTQNHTVYSVTVNAPFRYLGCDPALPIVVPAGADDAAFVFSVRTPDQPGASLALNLTINALTPSAL